MTTTKPDQAKALMQRQFLAWFRACGVIYTEKGELKGYPVTKEILQPNLLQKTLQDVINWFQRQNLPARIILLKPRRKGSSTITAGIVFHKLSQAAEGTTGVLINGNEEQGNPMFKMLGRYSKYDTCFKDTNPCEVSEVGFTARWKNKSELRHATLGGKAALVGSGLQICWVTEEALFDSPGDDNIADAATRLGNIFIAVANTPGTLIIEESTARGKTGVFYERFTEAEPWETVKANDKFSGDCQRISLFFPWFVFPVEDIPPMSAEECAEFLNNLRGEEKEYYDRVKRGTGISLTGHQMAWRRWAISNLCDNDLSRFDRDFPWSADTAFTSSGSPRFDRRGLALLKSKLPTYAAPVYTNFTMQGNDPFSWSSRVTNDRVPTAYEATWWIYEDPMPGRRYLVVVDPAEGKTTPTARDPDNHGIAVWRAGFRDSGGFWHPPKMVARAAAMDGHKVICRWDPSYAEKEIFKVARYYGGTNKAMIVIERPIDCGMNRTLRDRGCNLYVQKRHNTIDNVEYKEYGFLQSSATRPTIIAGLDNRIKQNYTGEDGCTLDGGGVDIPDAWTVEEMENFVTKPTGKAEAGIGHDDQVLMTCMALECMEAATPYSPPTNLMPAFEREDRVALMQLNQRKRW